MAINQALMQPGISIKPTVQRTDIEYLLKEYYGLKCASIKELNGYDDKNFHVLVGDAIDNIYINATSENGYVLKIVNSLDSKKPEIFDAQNALLLYLNERDIKCPVPVITKEGHYNFIYSFSSGDHLVRLLEFVNGTILHQVHSSRPSIFYQCGKYTSKLDLLLKDFHHNAIDNHKSIWMMDCVPKLLEFLFAVTDTVKRTTVKEVVADFEARVLSTTHQLERGIIHGDINEQNVLLDENNGDWFVKGILDFGDIQLGCYLYELAISIAYMIIEAADWKVGGYVLAGYVQNRPIVSQEISLLKTCVCARMCQSLVLGAYTALQDPENTYLSTTAKTGWKVLAELWYQPHNVVQDEWLNTVQTYDQKKRNNVKY